MPLMFAPDGRQRIVPERAVDSYHDRGWTSDVASDDPPAASAPKGDWVTYAQARGVDTDGMTKDEIRDAVA